MKPLGSRIVDNQATTPSILGRHSALCLVGSRDMLKTAPQKKFAANRERLGFSLLRYFVPALASIVDHFRVYSGAVHQP